MRGAFSAAMIGIVIVLGWPGAVRSEERRFFDGLIEPSQVVALSSQVPGIVEAVRVERGERVKKGQVVALLNADIEKAAAQVTRARVEFAKRKVARNEDLYRKQLISVHDKDEMETELRIAEAQLHEDEEKVKLRTIASPLNGVVVERLRAAGEYVGAEPILKIAQVDPLYVEVVVPVESFGSLKTGMQAEGLPELPLPGRFSARVTIVDMVIDAASGTFGVRLELDNRDYRLPAGLKCKVGFKP